MIFFQGVAGDVDLAEAHDVSDRQVSGENIVLRVIIDYICQADYPQAFQCTSWLGLGLFGRILMAGTGEHQHGAEQGRVEAS